MAKCKVDGVKCAKAGARSDQRGRGIILCGEGHNLLKEVTIILDVAAHALVGRSPFGVPTLLVYTIHTEELDRTVFQARAQGIEHAEVFPLIETAKRGGKDDGACPAGAEDKY